MSATDQILARYAGEIEESEKFLEQVVNAAQEEGRDLTAKEMELVTRARDKMQHAGEQMEPLKAARDISDQSAKRIAEIHEYITPGQAPPEVQYRSAGEYVLDIWKSGLGGEDATKRLRTFNRAAAHQTTADNPGLLPEQILGPIISFVDDSRPLVSALGPRQLPSGSWSRPKITQHTNVAAQSAEKTELVSQKMTITKVPVTAATLGGYVNVSRQDIDWTSPGIMDIVIQDLASVYAQKTELALCTVVDAATTAGPVIPTGTATPAAVAAALWTAAGTVYSAMKGAGRLIFAVSPDMLGLVGPLFAPINPQNAQSTGFSAGSFGSGAVGAISGISVVMSPQFDAGTMIVLSSAAVEVYEDRIGSLQVVEPSVLGVQVAYAGYFASLVVDSAGIIEITKTP